MNRRKIHFKNFQFINDVELLALWVICIRVSLRKLATSSHCTSVKSFEILYVLGDLFN